MTPACTIRKVFLIFKGKYHAYSAIYLLHRCSEDSGATWQFSEPIVGAGNVQPTFALAKDGSITEGKTWPFRKVIVNGEPGSVTRGHYPAIIQASDGTIHITYTNQVASPDGKSEVKNIAHAFFSEEWLRQQ